MDKVLREEQRRKQKEQEKANERVKVQQTEAGATSGSETKTEESGGIQIKDEASREVLRKLIAAQKRTYETVRGLCNSVERIGEDLDTALDLIAETQDSVEKLEGRMYVVEKVLKGHEDRLNEGRIGGVQKFEVAAEPVVTQVAKDKVAVEAPGLSESLDEDTYFRLLYYIHKKDGGMDWDTPFMTISGAERFDPHPDWRLWVFKSDKVLREATKEEYANFVL